MADPKQLRFEINMVMGDPSHPYHHSDHPCHRQSVADMESMWKGVARAEGWDGPVTDKEAGIIRRFPE
jgi:hypothetical protein